jgi:hypothetical protein
MFSYGFSTGALALGDFRQGLTLLRGTSATAVELSALRDHELPGLIRELDRLDLSQYSYVSVHAPSRFDSVSESAAAEFLTPCAARGWRIVLHPDAIRDRSVWRAFGPLLCVENMDKRKPTGRTAEELRRVFAELPDASLCLDLAHVRQVDTTMAVARQILAEFGDRMAQIHLSELDARSQHVPLSMASVRSFQEIAHWLKPVPVILESRVTAEGIAAELGIARLCFQPGPADARSLQPAI